MSFQTSGALSTVRHFQSVVATGGKDNNLCLWDLEDPSKPIFSAKNVRPTTLDLQVPVWITDICFVPKHNGRLVLTSSRFGEVNIAYIPWLIGRSLTLPQAHFVIPCSELPIFNAICSLPSPQRCQLSLYDTRCGQRRPVSRHAWRLSRKHGKLKVGRGFHGAVMPDLDTTRPITHAVAYDDAPGVGVRVVAGNVIGDVCRLDMRLPEPCQLLSTSSDTEDYELPLKPGMVKSRGGRAPEAPVDVHSFKGASGSITGLACGGAGEANGPIATATSRFNNDRLIVVSSYDRYLRIYDRDSGTRLAKVCQTPCVCSFNGAIDKYYCNLKS